MNVNLRICGQLSFSHPLPHQLIPFFPTDTLLQPVMFAFSPSKIIPRSDEDEQPNDFLDERYSLRQVLYDPPRRTELFIVLTMYNVSRSPLALHNSVFIFDRRTGGRGALLSDDAWCYE